MYKFLTLLSSLIFAILFTACQSSQLSITGQKRVTVGFTQHYSSELNTDNNLHDIPYEWEIISQDLNFTLDNKNKRETDFKALEAGFYTLKLTITQDKQIFSNELSITAIAPDIVDGHILPPEPDKTLNNATLIGVDINSNGVRDDVERWIYLKMKIYNGYPKIERALAMQHAHAYQMVMIDPTNKDDKVEHAISDSTDCRAWYGELKNLYLDVWTYDSIDDAVFNTRKRLSTYLKYNASLSGRVFTLTHDALLKQKCTVDIEKLD